MKKLNLILLIDDNDADNEFHEIVITEANVTAQLKNITSSRQALEYLTNCLAYKNDPQIPVPDLVFLDINMPVMNGFELLDKLRTVPDPYNQKVQMQIFMLTSSVNPADSKTASEEYADLIKGFRRKPLTDTIFLHLIQHHFLNR